MNRISKQPRPHVTEQLIADALLALMKQYPFDDITITQICQEAQVSRQSYYRNYNDKQEILYRYFKERWLTFQEAYVFSPAAVQENISSVYRHLPFSKELLSILCRDSLFFILEQASRDAAVEISRKMPFFPILDDRKYDLYRYTFIASTFTSVLYQWTLNEFQESLEELGQITKIFFAGFGQTDGGNQ